MSEGSGFRTEEGQIQKGAGTVAIARGELDNLTKQLRSEVASNAASWQGTAAVAFTKLMTRWDESSHLLITALDEFEANLRGTDKNYNVIEEEAQQAMDRIAASLP